MQRDLPRWLPGVVTLLALALVWLAFGPSLESSWTKRVDYSELRRRIAAGEAARVVIATDVIRAEGRPPAGASETRPITWIADRVEDPELLALLEEMKIPYTGEREGPGFGTLIFFWGLPLAFLALLFLLPRVGGAGGAGAALGFARSRARVVATENVGVSFEDVAGVDEAKEELREVVEFLREPARFARLGARIPKGVLLVGPPGTGKTLLARAVAGEARVAFFSLTGSEFVELFVGVGAARVRDLFAQAQQKAPCIVFIDELDALGKARGATLVANEEREQTLNQLLAEMDGFDPRSGVIIMAATNRPEVLDPALLRPGRFDRQVVVDRPDLAGREAILRVHARGIRLAPEVDLHAVAAATPGFAGAELANVLNEAALLATRRDKGAVDPRDLQDAIDRVVAGLEKKNRLMSPSEKRRVAHHEAGHALVGARLSPDAPVRKISIIPRGVAALGYTLQLPLEDRYLMTRDELAAKIAVMLAGRAAEELCFGNLSTGAADDLRHATDLATRMVREFGMSERLGPLTFEPEPPSPLLPTRLAPRAPSCSERTLETIDEEIHGLVDEAYGRARALLERERPLLERLAAALLEREVLEGPELRALLAAAAPIAAAGGKARA